MRPWHYQDPFFQEPPEASDAGFDKVYAPLDIPGLCREFYAGIGLPVDDVLARSDLYERKGKCPHAFCSDLDRAGDVHVLANIVPNEMWLETLLHELGHSVYSSKNIPRSVPYALRCESHILTTEGVAIMYGRFADNPGWLQAMGVKLADPQGFRRIAAQRRRSQLLIFSRWCQVMFRFEMALYANPEQDLNRLWWDLVEKYQEIAASRGPRRAGLRQPRSTSSPRRSITTITCSARCSPRRCTTPSPATCSTAAAPATAVYVGNKAAGDFMQGADIAPGDTLDWRQLTRFATGADLSPQAMAEDFSKP